MNNQLLKALMKDTLEFSKIDCGGGFYGLKFREEICVIKIIIGNKGHLKKRFYFKL